MSLTNYTELQAAVARWANRTNLTADIPDFVVLAEGRMSVDLSVKALETKQNATITAGVATLPDDVIEVRGLRIVGATVPDVEVTSLEVLEQKRFQAYAGSTTYGALIGRTVELYPNTTGTLSVRAKCRVPALASNSTNWVLTNFPAVYLFGTLVEVADFLKDDTSLTKWAARYAEAVGKANGALVYGGQGARSVVHGVR